MTRRVFMPHQSAMITTCLSFVSLINVGPSESISSSRRLLSMWCSRHMRNPPQRIHAASSLALYAFYMFTCSFAFSTVQPQLRDNSLRRNQSLDHRMQIVCSCIQVVTGGLVSTYLRVIHCTDRFTFDSAVKYISRELIYYLLGLEFSRSVNLLRCRINRRAHYTCSRPFSKYAKCQNTISLLINFGIHITWEHTKWRIFG